MNPFNTEWVKNHKSEKRREKRIITTQIIVNCIPQISATISHPWSKFVKNQWRLKINKKVIHNYNYFVTFSPPCISEINKNIKIVGLHRNSI